MKQITMRDIARLAGVSLTTASLSFRPGSRISSATRQKVLDVAHEQHYVPNQAARALRSRSSNTIGILVPDLTNPFYATLIRQADETASGRRHRILSAESEWTADREIEAIETMAQSRVAGLLLCSSEASPESFALLEKYAIPHVVMDTAPSDYPGPFVGNDLSAAGALAAEHLLSVGCKRLAMLTGDEKNANFSGFQKIQQGFVRAIQSHGIAFDKQRLIHAGLTFDDGITGGLSLLERFGDTDGIFCINDSCAYGVIEVLTNNKLRPGRDVAVIGIDDLETSRMSLISLTSIRQPYAKLAEIAANILIDIIEKKTIENIRITLPPELIIRDSTGKFQ